MDDTISRQAALKALEKNRFPGAHYIDIGVKIALREIKALPSAQPEQQWIPCSERLPEKNCRCLTTNTAWGAFEVDFNVWINGEWLYPNEKPIAWMPLPEPAKLGGD